VTADQAPRRRNATLRLALGVALLVIGVVLALPRVLPERPPVLGCAIAILVGVVAGVALALRRPQGPDQGADWLIALVLLGGWFLVRDRLGEGALAYLALGTGAAVIAETLGRRFRATTSARPPGG